MIAPIGLLVFLGAGGALQSTFMYMALVHSCKLSVLCAGLESRYLLIRLSNTLSHLRLRFFRHIQRVQKQSNVVLSRGAFPHQALILFGEDLSGLAITPSRPTTLFQVAFSSSWALIDARNGCVVVGLPWWKA